MKAGSPEMNSPVFLVLVVVWGLVFGWKFFWSCMGLFGFFNRVKDRGEHYAAFGGVFWCFSLFYNLSSGWYL